METSDFYFPIAQFIDNASKAFDRIPSLRAGVLDSLADYITTQLAGSRKVSLNFICTHNSRRSHIAQIWAQALAAYYRLENIETYSGGTEATAFNPRAVKAMQRSGFQIEMTEAGNNPVYEIRFSPTRPPIKVYSKVYDAPGNPSSDFCAVMTCSHADENCPFIPGASKRVALTYDDPKDFDDTALETIKYDERVNEIGRELTYAFSRVRPL